MAKTATATKTVTSATRKTTRGTNNQNRQKNSVFKHHLLAFAIKPIYGPKKHQCTQLVFLIFFFCARSG